GPSADEAPAPPPAAPPSPPAGPPSPEPHAAPPSSQQPTQAAAPGAFGAPQPGYGYPPQPPAGAPSTQKPPQGPPPPQGQSPAAGYGFPQAPGQPPAAPHPGQPGQPNYPGQPYGAPQPGYGYPGQGGPGSYHQPTQPGLYGQPTQPGTYPPPAPYGQPGQSAPGSGSGNKKLIAIVASVVAVAIIAVGGIFLFTGGDSGEEAKGDDKKSGETGGQDGGTGGEGGEDALSERDGGPGDFVFKVDAPQDVPAEILMSTPGFWTTDKAVIKYEHDAVRGYDLKSGEEVWTVPAVRGDRCAAAPQASGGKTMILWGRKCEKAMGIDLTSGKKLWTKDLPAPKGADMASPSFPQAAVSGDIGAVAWLGGHAAYDLTSGAALWEAGDAYSGCNERAYIGGQRLLAFIDCGSNGESLRLLDNEGEKVEEWPAPKGTEIQHVLSTDPLVVGVNAGGSDSLAITDLFVLSDTLEYQRKISIDEDRFRFRSEGIGISDVHNVVTDKERNLIYLETASHQSGDVQTNEVVSYDLGTGELKTAFEHGKNGPMIPVGLQDGTVLAYYDGSYSGPSALYALDTDTGKAEPYMELPRKEGELLQDMGRSANGRLVWAQNTLFFDTLTLYRDTSLNDALLAAVR
ncbi:PQQ-binding-like beta-propeller repeat protein, partial [Streptomyces sp. JJ66]|uniref:outer membrane protein assembly factor BamB family protein n=1 Tax=Streptomyces sp. JJ66 TaxID=2803843 RepID=UPI001C596457